MSPRIPEDDLPYDQHGYREYGVMLRAPLRQRRIIRRFHEAIGLSDFATQAHVSVWEFGQPRDLGEVMARLSLIAVKTRPFSIAFDVAGAKPWGEGFAGGFPVTQDLALMALREAVQSALDPIAKSTYPAGSRYRPHLTAYLAAAPEEAERAKRLLPELNLGAGYIAKSVELSARRGPARGGNYTVLASFPFGLRVGPENPTP